MFFRRGISLTGLYFFFSGRCRSRSHQTLQKANSGLAGKKEKTRSESADDLTEQLSQEEGGKNETISLFCSESFSPLSSRFSTPGAKSLRASRSSPRPSSGDPPSRRSRWRVWACSRRRSRCSSRPSPRRTPAWPSPRPRWTSSPASSSTTRTRSTSSTQTSR